MVQNLVFCIYYFSVAMLTFNLTKITGRTWSSICHLKDPVASE